MERNDGCAQQTTSPTGHASGEERPAWSPLSATDRRVLGVLIEKAKTTPDAYPLSLNALKNGCNQKSNRFPQTELDEADVEDAMERLRLAGAAAVIQGGHRVDKYRHLAYDWLGVDKFEIAVMAELLLRGAQTLGELRGRAARMEPIAGLPELRPVLEGLLKKNLIVYLTPAGRGAIVTHNLYSEREMEKQVAEHGGGVRPPSPVSAPEIADQPSRPSLEADRSPSNPSQSPPPTLPSATPNNDPSPALVQELEQIRQELASVKMELVELRENAESKLAALRDDINALNAALGNS